MADDIFTDAGLRRDAIDTLVGKIGIAADVIEKDLWVCWALAQLQKVADLPKLTFKGGTSLSKVHGLIQRFSEDLDLTFSREKWGFDGERDPLSAGLSKKKRAALVEEISKQSAQVVSDRVIPGLRTQIQNELGGAGWSVELAPSEMDESLQTVLFKYPSVQPGYNYVLPFIRMEFGARGDPWPTELQVVAPYIEQEFTGMAPTAVASVDTLRPERTFWEKATLLHELHHLTIEKPERPTTRLSRHAYDLHKIWALLREPLAAGQDLLRRVVQHKECFFARPSAKYELVLQGTLNTTPHEALEANLRADFADMQVMFFPGHSVPTFDEVMASLRQIDAVVAAWDWSQAAAQ